MVENTPATIKLKGVVQSTMQVGTDNDNNPIIETVLLCPAADSYSYPPRYCIMSKARIGEKGQEINVNAEVVCRPWKDQNKKWRYPHDLWIK